MAKTINTTSVETQGLSDKLFYHSGSDDKETSYNQTRVVGREHGKLASNAKNGHRNRLMRYKFNAPDVANNVNISQISKVKIEFTGNTYGFGLGKKEGESGYDNYVDALVGTGKIKCFISTDPNAQLERDKYLADWFSITYTGKSWDRPYSEEKEILLIPGETYYLFVTADIPQDGNVDAWCYWGDAKAAATLTFTYETYTQVSAPTKIIANKAIVKPGDSLTISWSGQVDGIQNVIAGYKLAYKIGEDGEYTETQIFKNPEFEYTPAETNRGKSIFCKVMTKGAVDGFDSEWSSEFQVSRINQLPSAPTAVLIGKNIVPSTGGHVSFNVAPGADDDSDLQGVNVQYSFDDKEEKTAYVSGTPISISKNTTIKFWSWDGLENSANCVSTQITKNTKPAITKLNITGKELKVKTTVQSGYIVSPTINVEAVSGGQDNNTYTYYCKDVEENVYQLETSSSNSYTIADIRKYIPPASKIARNYSLGVMRNDGIENSEILWKSGYQISALPTIEVSGFQNSAEVGFEDKYDTNLYISLDPRDEGYTRVRLALANDTSRYQEININGLEVNTLTATISPRGQTNSLIASYGSLSWYHSQTKLFTLYRVNQIELGTPTTNSLTNNYYQVYTQPDLIYTMRDPFNNNPQNYGFKTAELKYFYKDQDVTKETSDESGIDNLTTKLNCPVLSKEILSETEEKNGVSTIKLEIRATNVFGAIYSKKVDLNINFNEEILISSWDLQTNGAKEGTYGTFEDWDYIKEKMSLYLTASASSYNGPLTMYLEYTQNNGTTWYTLGEPISLTSDAKPSHNKPVTYSIKNKEFQIGEIAQAELSRNFRVRFVNDVGSKISKTTKDNIKFRGHYPASVFMVNPSINDTILTTDYVIKGGGIETSLIDLKLRVEKEEGYEDIEGRYKEEDDIYSFTSKNFKGVDSIRAALLATTQLEPSWKSDEEELDEVVKTTLTTQKTSRIIYSIVYNLVPTISLRKNYLGVNTLNPEYEDAIMVIGEVSGRQTIYFNGISGYCKFDGFVFDGGTW